MKFFPAVAATIFALVGCVADDSAWFDVTAPGGTHPQCQWSHRSDEPSSRAFSRMVRDLIGR